MTESLFAEASQRLDAALHHISISEDAITSRRGYANERLKFPKSSLQVSIPVRMDNVSLQVFQGYRVRYDDTTGPTKGGIRYHPSVTLDEVKSLAFQYGSVKG